MRKYERSERDVFSAPIAPFCEGRLAADAAVEEQRTHFDMLGLQLGYAYESGALVPDGTPQPPPVSPSVFEPSARPGARIPHAWLVPFPGPSFGKEGNAVLSSLDLIASDAMTLVSFSDHEVWSAAAAAIKQIPLIHHRVGIDVKDADGTWGALCELRNGGALIVRPDQHVAARFTSTPDSTKVTLAAALDQILSRI